MIAQIPMSVPMPNTRLTQLIRFGSASLGTSMPAALAAAARSRGSRSFPLQCADCDRVERRALQAHQSAARRIGINHPGRRRGRTLGTHPHSHRGQRCREIAVEAALRG